MSCFLVQVLPSMVENLPSGLAAIPLSPEMKMAPSLIEDILTLDPMVARVEASFCLGEVSTIEEATDLAQDLLDDLFDSHGRSLRTDSFISSRSIRDSHREQFWRRSLQAPDEGICQAMLNDFVLEVSDSMMVLFLPPETRDERYRECLQAVAVDLAQQPEVCAVSALQPLKTSNVIGSGIVQSGQTDYKPFYDAGLDGKGQIIALSDTGIDLNNCYFYDSKVSTPQDGSVQYNARKVIQYVSFTDNSDYIGGHGSKLTRTVRFHFNVPWYANILLFFSSCCRYNRWSYGEQWYNRNYRKW